LHLGEGKDGEPKEKGEPKENNNKSKLREPRAMIRQTPFHPSLFGTKRGVDTLEGLRELIHRHPVVSFLFDKGETAPATRPLELAPS
jgi:hypothetical protein